MRLRDSRVGLCSFLTFNIKAQTRKINTIHYAQTPMLPPISLPLTSSLTVRNSSQRKRHASAVQTAVETYWWFKLLVFCFEVFKIKSIFQRTEVISRQSCYYNWGNQTFGPNFWWHKFIKHHFKRNLASFTHPAAPDLMVSIVASFLT